MFKQSRNSSNFPATERSDSSLNARKLLTVASFGMNDVEAALLDSFVKLANRTRGGGFVMLGHKADAAMAAHVLITPLTPAQLDPLLTSLTGLTRRKQQMLVSTTPVNAATVSLFVDVVMPPLRPIPVMDVLVRCKDLFNEQSMHDRGLSVLADEGAVSVLPRTAADAVNGAAHTAVSLEIWKDSATAVDVARVIIKARSEAAVYQIGFDATTTVFIDGVRGLLVAQQSVDKLLAELPVQNILGVRISPPEPQFPVSSLDNLCWLLAHDTLPARLLPWLIDGDGAFQITRWPNFGRLRRTATDLSLAAMLSKQRLSPVQLAKALKMPQDDVQRFINACSLLGLLGPLKLAAAPLTSAPYTATAITAPNQAPAQTFKRPGLLAMIKNRLGLK